MEYVGLVADEIEMRGVPDPPVCWKLKYAKTFLLVIDYWGQMIKMVSMDIVQASSATIPDVLHPENIKNTTTKNENAPDNVKYMHMNLYTTRPWTAFGRRA